MMTSAIPAPTTAAATPRWARFILPAIMLFSRIPDSLIAFIGRFAIAAVFWQSGQTKIDGLAINIIAGDFTLGIPSLSESAVALFQDEYQRPLLPASVGGIRGLTEP